VVTYWKEAYFPFLVIPTGRERERERERETRFQANIRRLKKSLQETKFSGVSGLRDQLICRGLCRHTGHLLLSGENNPVDLPQEFVAERLITAEIMRGLEHGAGYSRP
jgi:hypothetical protein